VHPTSIEQLFAVADAGRVMPPKSTWFEPKLRDGLIVRPSRIDTNGGDPMKILISDAFDPSLPES